MGAMLWAVVIGLLGFLCGHILELIIGEITHLEVPILIAMAIIGGLLFFFEPSSSQRGAGAHELLEPIKGKQ